MTKWCTVPNCKTGSKTATKKFTVFRVPRDTDLRNKWENAIPGIFELSLTDVVCEKHFNEEEIVREWVKYDENGKQIARVPYKNCRLRKHAVPSKFEDALAKINDCAPMHEYAEPISDFEKDPEVFANVSIESFSLVTPDIEERNSCTDTTESISAIGANICEEEAFSGIEENDPDPSESFVTEKVDEMQSLMEINNGIPNENSVVNRDFSGHVPPGWAWVNMHNEIVKQTLFTYPVTKFENDVPCPVIQKAVTLDANDQFKYFVYGRHILTKDNNFENTLNGKAAVNEILEKFKAMNVCCSVGDNVNRDLVKSDAMYQDQANNWRSNECSLITRKKRCESCMKTRKRIMQQTARLNDSSLAIRIGNLYNPADRGKLMAMRLKVKRERRQRLRAEERLIKNLTEDASERCGCPKIDD